MNKSSFFLLLFSGILLFIFYYSGKSIPIRIFDEAIYANNAVDMSLSHNYIELTNAGSTFFYNTKPPLAIWFQSISISVFGINEFAVRLPSLMAVLIVIMAMIYFLRRYRQSFIVQLIAVLTLLTSGGYMNGHGAGTGDLDAILCLWTTLLCLTVIDMVLETGTVKLNKKIWMAGLFFFLGFFTKSTAIFLLIPGLLVCLIFFGRWRQILINKQTGLVLLAGTGLIILYYAWVDHVMPGYFKAVWFSEVERFYKNIMPWHRQPFLFYFKILFLHFYPWIFFLPLTLLSSFSKEAFIRKCSRALLLICLVYIFFISIPPDKLEWYIAPLYPLLSVAISLGLYETYTRLKNSIGITWWISVLTGLLLIYFLVFAEILNNRQHFELHPFEREGYFLRSSFTRIQPKSAKILMTVEHPEHYDQLNFYRKKYMHEYGSSLSILANSTGIKIGDTVLVCQAALVDSIGYRFKLDTLYMNKGCFMLKILDSKNKY